MTAATAQIDALIGKGQKKGKKSKSGGGVRKIGRSKRHPAMARYNSEHRWDTNKKRKLRRHLRNHPNDMQAVVALER